MKRFDIISIFPAALDSYFGTSILKRGQEKKLIKIQSHDLRKWSRDKHRKTDDKPYGGGAGMVMTAEPILRALRALKPTKKSRVILMAANGKSFTQAVAKRLATYDRLILVCGRYEGVDARVEKFIDEKISVGPYVLTGGELPAATVIDVVSRLVPGVVGKEESVQNESFSDGKTLEHAHYTRPEVLAWRGMRYRVPKVLLSGDHKSIANFRAKTSKKSKV